MLETKMETFKVVKSSRGKLKQMNKGYQCQVKSSTESLKKKLQDFQFSRASQGSQLASLTGKSPPMQVDMSNSDLQNLSDQELDGWETDGESVDLEAMIANEGIEWAHDTASSSVIHDKSMQWSDVVQGQQNNLAKTRSATRAQSKQAEQTPSQHQAHSGQAHAGPVLVPDMEFPGMQHKTDVPPVFLVYK